MDDLRLRSFLKLGYFIDYVNTHYVTDLSRIYKDKYSQLHWEELVTLGMRTFRAAIAEQFEAGKQHVVPLSGGLDSRALVAVLLEFTEADNIYTYTYGTPNTYDYEIGCHVARVAGTRHTTFSLDECSYHEDELLDIAQRLDCQAFLFHHPPVWTMDKLFAQGVVWSGFVGDAVAGGFVRDPPVTDLVMAKELYVRNRTVVRSIDLSRCPNRELIGHVAGGDLPFDVLTYEEQILFRERVDKLTRPQLLMKGYNYKTPFINNSWMEFLLSIPNQYRDRQLLYIEILTRMCPKLFSLPTKNTFGLPIDSSRTRLLFRRLANKVSRTANRLWPLCVNRMLNYMDFNEAIRSRRDLNTIVYDNVMDLKRRHLIDWIDIDGIWSRHQRRTRNHGDALIVLASLEIILKARELQENEVPENCLA